MSSMNIEMYWADFKDHRINVLGKQFRAENGIPR